MLEDGQNGQPGQQPGQPLKDFTAAGWHAFVTHYRRDRPTVHASLPADFVLRFHGGRPEAVAAFDEAPGLPLGQFAACMGVPATSVRYYTRLGLLPYFRVDQRHLYPSFACMTVAQIVQLRCLGLGIAEITARLAQEHQLSQDHREAVERGGVTPGDAIRAPADFQAALDTPDAQAASERLRADQEAFAADLQTRLTAERDAAQARLDEWHRLRPQREG